MKNQCVHFVDSIVYLMEQTATYCAAKGAQYFMDNNMEVSLDEYIIIDTISFNPGICQRDLSKMILKDRSYTSRVLNLLEDKKFITRNVEEKGKRLVKKLFITKLGEKMLEENHIKIENLFNEVFKDITEEEFDAIKNGLNKMKDCISKFTTLPL